MAQPTAPPTLASVHGRAAAPMATLALVPQAATAQTSPPPPMPGLPLLVPLLTPLLVGGAIVAAMARWWATG
ncbi:MAG: hypothetical protein RLZZ117_1967 [Cyanobacteriota bacterium]|jgi:hypothetical protein